MTVFQFSPVTIWNTVSSDQPKVSKVLRGTALRPTAARYSQRTPPPPPPPLPSAVELPR